jgi:RNA polymerase sigma-70 factor (ECF subfamily)
MPEMPDTRETLLARLEDQSDRDAWDQFSALYAPVIYRLARGRGMQDADAQDLTQHVLITVARAIPRWQSNGEGTRFRRWLRRVTKNATINALTRKPRDLAAGGSSRINRLREHPEQDSEASEAIDWESRREVYRLASLKLRREIQSETWEIFARTVVDGESVQAVSIATGKSVGSIYVAKCRVLNRLRELARELEDDE